MAPEKQMEPKDTSISMKALEIISTFPVSEDFWTLHEEEKKGFVINPQGQTLVQTIIKESGYTTRVETTHGKVSVTLLRQYYDPSISNDSPLILRIINTGDEDYPVEFNFGSPEKTEINNEIGLAYNLFLNLQQMFKTETTEQKDPYKLKVEETVTDVINELHQLIFS
ncbi:MAG: hypothetical protein ABH812_02425 [bacterium]